MTIDDLRSVKDVTVSVPFMCEVMIYERIPEAQTHQRASGDRTNAFRREDDEDSNPEHHQEGYSSALLNIMFWL